MFNDVDMETSSFDKIAEGIYCNASIESLYFNNCKFRAEFSLIFKKIISTRGQKLNEVIWLKGLRNDDDD